MIYPQVSVIEWATLYKIETSAMNCAKCHKIIELTVPVAFGKYRGLCSLDHGCGNEFCPATLISLDPKIHRLWTRNILDLKERK